MTQLRRATVQGEVAIFRVTLLPKLKEKIKSQPARHGLTEAHSGIEVKQSLSIEMEKASRTLLWPLSTLTCVE